MRRIETYLPKLKPKPERKLFQAKIDPELMREVRMILKIRRITWSAMIEACLRKFIDEVKGG